MSFADPWLLWGLLLGVVPLVLHLWKRRQPVRLPWAAMQFLTAAIEKNRRRLQLEELWQLAFRLGIIMLPAVALARPIWSSAAITVSKTPSTLQILLLDTTLSMGTLTAARVEALPSALSAPQNQPSAWSRALDRAREIVNNAPQGTAFQLVLLQGDEARALISEPSRAKAEILRELDQLQLTQSAGNPLASLRRVRQWLTPASEREPLFEQQVVSLITDLQESTWDLSPGSPTSQILLEIQQQAALQWEDVGFEIPTNYAITEVEILAPILLRKESFRLEVTVTSLGKPPADPAPLVVFLKVDGQLSQTAPVILNSQELQSGRQIEANISFDLRFEVAGERTIEVGLDRKENAGKSLGLPVDERPQDDVRYLVAPIRDRLKILLVDGKPAKTRFENATDFLRLALDPGDEQDQYQINVIPADELLSNRLPEYDVVCLCDLPELSANELNAVEAYLRQGGGLIIGFGSQIQLGAWRSVLNQAASWWPLELDSIVGSPENPEEIFSFDPLNYQHPILFPFAGQSGTGLSATKTFAYLRMLARPEIQSQVALQFSSGDPAIVTSSVGAGRLVIVATPFDRTWGTWALWGHSLVPLSHEMVRYAAADSHQVRSTIAGEPAFPHAAILKAMQSQNSSNETSASSWIWRTPAGADTLVTPQPDQALAVPYQAGLYRLSRSTPELIRTQSVNPATSREPSGHATNWFWFAVNPDIRESSLARWPFPATANDSNRTPESNTPPISQQPGQETTTSSAPPVTNPRVKTSDSHSENLPRWLLLLVLLLLLSEGVFGGGVFRRSTQTQVLPNHQQQTRPSLWRRLFRR
ncbi:hypothetical protein Spb1_00740 [Planctopirus ephydatiae]|uniref:Aerotolerance regulator N-terminal domain-containing protein n=1 Tax=Planctopirus ephydatiae TaxID=2528019 RepID=A0A518GHY5_9PLAN|nr:BatA domain-containing protein [Planctopirus ephydatiae]QDV28211.1 hypothetical protein Spb1_00740 [Planctopirus ephydatiae]